MTGILPDSKNDFVIVAACRAEVLNFLESIETEWQRFESMLTMFGRE
jgi:hypothetical protein